MKNTKKINKKLTRNNYNKKQRKTNLQSKKNNNNYKIIKFEDISKTEIIKCIKKITTLNLQIPLIGYLSIENLRKMIQSRKSFFIYKSNIFIGIIFFYNITYEFKKTLLGSKYIFDKDLKSSSDVNNYIINWSFIHYDINKFLINTVIDIFRKINNLYNKNIIITLFKYLELKNNKLDILFKYKPIINYKNSDEYKNLNNMGFIYNGYHITMHNELINLYSMRFINKLSRDDFFPTYIITRQFKLEPILNLNNIKKFLFNDGLITIKNINRFSIDNTILFNTNSVFNNITSIYGAIPYKFNFVINYITNKLGNMEIIKNYVQFYFAAKAILGNNIKYFCKIINSYDDALNILINNNGYLLLTPFDIITLPDIGYYFVGFNNKLLFEKYISENSNKVLHGFDIKDSTYINHMLELKTDTTYFILPYILFTYINNKLKCFVWKDIAFLIYKQKEKDFYNNINEMGILDFLVEPQIFAETFNTYVKKPINIDKMIMKIKKVCSFVGKVYKKHVSLDINQIHGFTSIQLALHLIKDNDDIEPIVANIRGTPPISNSKNYEHSKWIYDLAILPALYPDFKCDNTELHYQPLDID